MSSVTFLYPLKTSEKHKFFMFSGGYKNLILDINALKEQPLEVFLENKSSEKYVLKSSQVNLWSKYFKNTFEGAHFSWRSKTYNFTKKWTSSQVFLKGFNHRFQNTFFPE